MINYLIVLFVFLLPISMGAANTILGTALLLWIIEGDFKNKFLLLKSEKIFLLFIAIGLITLVSALLSPNLSQSFLAGEHKSIVRVILSHYLLTPFIMAIILTSLKKPYTEHMISAFLIAIFISEMASYLIFFHIVDLSYFQSLHLLYKNATYHNPTPFMHHTEYSVFLSIATVFLLHKLLHTKKRYIQLFILLFLTSATINLFINGGRTGQIAYLLATMSYLLFYFTTNFKSILATLVLLSSIVVLAYQFSPVFHARAQAAIEDTRGVFEGNYTTSWGIRAASDMVALDYLTSSPSNFILGAGAGHTREVYLTHADNYFSKNISQPIRGLSHLHNQYFQYWMDGGIIPLILFILYFVWLTKLKIPREMKILLYSFSIVVAFACVSDIPFFRYRPAMLFYVISGYFIYLSHHTSKSKVA